MGENKGQEIQEEAQIQKEQMLERQLKALLIRLYCKLVEKLRLADEKYHEYIIRYGRYLRILYTIRGGCSAPHASRAHRCHHHVRG